MKHRLARLAVLLVGVLGLVVTTTPAEATTVKVITFNGTAVVTGGTLGYPCTLNNLSQCPPNVTTTTKPGPKGVPVVNITPGGNHADFNFSSTLCLKDSVSTVNKPTQKNGVAEPCVIFGTGAVWGFCGFSTGQGTLTIHNLAGTKGSMNTITVFYKFTEIGGVFHITGGSSTQWLVAEVSVVPVITIGGPSCLNKTANAFAIDGTAAILDKTPPLA